MATIQRNSAWHQLTEVKKGDYGEELVRKALEDCGFVVYQAITEKAHLIDFIVERHKNLIFAVDVKTKEMMKKYAETGFNYSHFKEYQAFSERSRLPVLIAFVDKSKKKIYGNFLSVLEEPRQQHNINYPKTMPAKFYKQGDLIRYYPECAMLPLGDLTDNDVEILTRSTFTHY